MSLHDENSVCCDFHLDVREIFEEELLTWKGKACNDAGELHRELLTNAISRWRFTPWRACCLLVRQVIKRANREWASSEWIKCEQCSRQRCTLVRSSMRSCL